MSISSNSRKETQEGNHFGPGAWLSGLMWCLVILMLVILGWAVSQRTGITFSPAKTSILAGNLLVSAGQETGLEAPEFLVNNEINSLYRLSSLHTVIPERERANIATYDVQTGDSVFNIAKEFKIEPETVLWANSDILDDNPNMLSVGQKLKIPAVDGVIYKWKSNDTIEGVAKKFKTDPDEILTWPDNHLDMAEPKIASGTLIMIPGGSRELKTWVVPTLWRANSGASRNIQTGCDASGGTAYGSGAFVWPSVNHSLSGNDYWSGHLGIDIAAATGAPVYAADSGVVVYSGSISGGYGLMIMIDHGNGFHTLYAHLSQLVARCGSNVSQGQTIAYSGSTGNSTGPHLHFEIRYGGAFVNPHDYVR
ncbi:MAG: peptidoglycan DD-metalloendopeptidase family protein [Anaerolineaceae bacterium]|nr:peptidoglycan DD-metalloendopeptidase family protein [Anaerolineaceae bacterium]